MKKIWLLLIALVVFNSPVNAFNKRNHKKIGRQAAELYYKLTGYKMTARQKRAFARGCGFEDKIKLWGHKAKNQHFYRHDTGLKEPRTFLRHLDSLHKKLKGFKQDGKDYCFWLTLGRITHYYQDMACPPHVVPIYHTSKDRFDDIKIECDSLKSEITVEKMNQLIKQPLLTLLDMFSEQTLSAVSGSLVLKIDTTTVTKTWEVFWTKDTTCLCSKKFGSYGIAGNNFGETKEFFRCKSIKRKYNMIPAFRDNHFICVDKAKKFTVEAYKYEDFKAKQLEQALEASMTMLHYGANL